MQTRPDNSTMTRRKFIKATAGTLALTAMFPMSQKLFAQATGEGGGQVEVKTGLCHICHHGQCSLRYTVKDGVIVGIEGAPDGPFNEGRACVRGLCNFHYAYNPYRIKTPLKRTNPQKGLDVDPGWVEISWEEALETVATKLKAIRESDPRKFIWFNGFPAEVAILKRRIFPAAFGTPNSGSGTGNLCSTHLTNAFMMGVSSSRMDFKFNKYAIVIGSTLGPNLGPSDGGTNYVLDAIENGMKITVVDPYCSTEAKLGDWVPIRPGSDLAFLLAMGHVILYELGRYDEWFLKNRSTAPYLLNPEGNEYQRHPVSNKPLIWDPLASAAKEFDDPSIADYALEGSYLVNGVMAKPSFAWIKEGMAEYTPEWAEPICTIPAETIRRLSRELVDAAQIGSTIDINGFTFPHRPACIIVARGMINHRDGHVAYWMTAVLNQLIGAISVPGGILGLSDNPDLLKPDEDGVVTRHAMARFTPFKLPPSRIDVPEFLPFAFATADRTFEVILEPEKYGLDYTPEVLGICGANFMTKGAARYELFIEGMRKIPFIFSLAYHIDEQALLSDLLLPDLTFLEQTSFFNDTSLKPGHSTKVAGGRGHKAIIEPLYNIPVPDDLLMDIAERAGFLYGERNSINAQLNRTLSGELALDVNKKYPIAEYIDRFLQSTYNVTLDEMAEKGYHVVEVPLEQAYSYYYYPENKTRHPFYNVVIRQAGDQLLQGLQDAGMKHPGFTEEDIRFYYRGVPGWKPTPAYSAPEEFDLYGIFRRMPYLIMDVGAAVSNPWLQEAASQNPGYAKLLLNSATAQSKGLVDGDLVYMESHCSLGGKIGPYPVKLTELIHPDAVGVLSGSGRVKTGMNPVTTRGITYNLLLSNAWEEIEMLTGACNISPRVKLIKA